MKKQRNRSMIHKILRGILFTFLAAGVLYFCAPVKAGTNYTYLIKVNKQQNTITIYTKDANGKYTVPYKAMLCSTGYATPTGTFRTPVKYRWKILLEDVWGQYCTRVVDSILFHSVWYYRQDPSSLSAVQFNKLGTTCSHGCIRLSVEDAKWIYDHCPIGTTVVIYNSSNPGPLGKPRGIKIPTNVGWDPTDPNPKNPIYGKYRVTQNQPAQNRPKPVRPTINGLKSYSVAWGSKVDLRKGITATSYQKKDLTSRIKITGEVDTKKPGIYRIVYSVTDPSCKLTTTRTIKVKVRECTYKLTLKGVKDRSIGKMQKVTKEFCLEGVKAEFGPHNITNQIKVTITHDVLSVYKVEYKVTSETGAVAKRTAHLYVDTEAPVFHGVKHHLINDYDVELTKDYLLKGVSATDNNTKLSKSDIKVTKEKLSETAYLVTYEVSDGFGNTTKETVQFTYEDIILINGVSNRVITKDTVVDEEFAMEGITATDNGTDITDQVQVTISEPKGGIYTVTYEASNADGDDTKIVAFFKIEK